MDFSRPMPLLLIEDDVAECAKFRDAAVRRNDIRFIGMTNSSEEGLKYVKTHEPECVILDLELHRGKGSGLLFLSELGGAGLKFLPLVIVVTNNTSNVVYDHAREAGADFVFYKKQSDYSADMVIDAALSLRGSFLASRKLGVPPDLQSPETAEQLRVRVTDKIDTELNLVGVGTHLKGRQYLFDAIYLMVSKPEPGEGRDSAFMQVAAKYSRTASSISRSMQTAIDYAWRMTPIEDLQRHYTARVDYKSGMPTPTEFVYYYADKIRRLL